MADPLRLKLNEILTESEELMERLDVATTVQKMGPKIEERLKKDNTANGITVEQFVERVIQVDPTPNQKYGMWIIRAYLTGGIQRYEDLYKVTEPLGIFHKFKAKMEIKDINQVKKLIDLIQMTEPFKDQQTGREGKKGEKDELINKGEAKVLYDDKRFSVVVPKTKEAACHFGKNTQWCTAATSSDNMFDHYAKNGDLYIILDKPNNRRWQFSFADQQFMDERDEPIKLYNFFKEHGELLKIPEFSTHFSFYTHADGEEGYKLIIPLKS
jgi:hypothetical protein